jgi:hypothetical protein
MRAAEQSAALLFCRERQWKCSETVAAWDPVRFSDRRTSRRRRGDSDISVLLHREARGVKLRAIPQPWHYAGILVFATTGTIVAKPSVVELSMLAGFGVMGFLMCRFDFPIVQVVIGLIFGPIAESQLRRAMAVSLAIRWRCCKVRCRRRCSA